MPISQEELEEELTELRARVATLERKPKSKAFTENTLALATDLDDLGSVKTRLDFEEVTAPDNPPAEVGRLFGVGRTGVNDTSLRYIDKDGNVSEVTHPPAMRAYPAGNIAAGNGVFTKVTASLESFDTDSMHSTTANTSRMTINTEGIYLFHGQIEFAANAVGARYIDILRDNATVIAKTSHLAAAISTRIHVWTLESAAAGGYYEIRGWQNSGGALNIVGNDPAETYFEAIWVGPKP